MKNIISFALLLFCPLNVLAQSTDALMSKAEEFGFQQLDSAIHYWEKAGFQAIAEGKNDVAADALEKAAGSLLFLDNHKPAVDIYQKMLSLELSDLTLAAVITGLTHQYVYDEKFEPDSLFKEGIALGKSLENDPIVVSNMGNYAVYLLQKGDIEMAMNYYLDALNYNPVPLQRLTVCINIANMFFSLDNPVRAKEYIDEAIRISKENNYKAQHQKVALQMGKYYLSQGKVDSAKLELNKIIEKGRHNANASLVEAYIILGELEYNNGALGKSEEYLRLSKEIKFTDESITLSRQNLLNVRIEQKKGNLQKALEICKGILEYLEGSNAKGILISTHRQLSELYELTGNTKASFFHFKEQKKIESQLYKTNLSIQVFEQEARFKRKEQEDAIALLDQQNEIKSLKLKAQNRIILFGGIALLAFSVLLFLLYRFFRQVKSQRNIIKSSLDQKDILLREIHHRVKNNLQMVSSLLSLQSKYIKDDAAFQAIKQSQSRVRSMALIHQDLYSNDNLMSIGVKEYLHKLCAGLYDAYGISSNDIELKLQIEDLELDVDTMIPLGLIVNELVTNSLKYAFPQRKEGQILIELKEAEELLQLTVEDNGVGFHLAEEGASSFGFKLIQTLCKRLKGAINIDSENGTRVHIQYSKYQKNRAAN